MIDLSRCLLPPFYPLGEKCADRFMAAVGKLAVREQALRADLAAGRISDDDPRWLDNRPISRLYAREGRE